MRKANSLSPLILVIIGLLSCSEGAKASVSISLSEACFHSSYPKATANPTLWCRATTNAGFTLADKVDHRAFVEFIPAGPALRKSGNFPLEDQSNKHDIFLVCVTFTTSAIITAISLASLNGTNVLFDTSGATGIVVKTPGPCGDVETPPGGSANDPPT